MMPSVQFNRSVVSNSLWPHEPQHTSLPVHHQLPESTQTHVHWVGDAIQPSHPLSSPSPFALNLSQYHGLFQWVSSSHQVAKVLEFQLQHQSFHWIWTGWISLQSKGLSRVFSNTTVQILWHSAFFIVQLSHPYMTTGKIIALTRRTFVDKVMSLFFNMLSRLAITFLPKSKPLLISWLQSLSAVILEPPKIKSATVSLSITCSDFPNEQSSDSWVWFLRCWLHLGPDHTQIPKLQSESQVLVKLLSLFVIAYALPSPFTLYSFIPFLSVNFFTFQKSIQIQFS